MTVEIEGEVVKSGRPKPYGGGHWNSKPTLKFFIEVVDDEGQHYKTMVSVRERDERTREAWAYDGVGDRVRYTVQRTKNEDDETELIDMDDFDDDDPIKKIYDGFKDASEATIERLIQGAVDNFKEEDDEDERDEFRRMALGGYYAFKNSHVGEPDVDGLDEVLESGPVDDFSDRKKFTEGDN